MSDIPALIEVVYNDNTVTIEVDKPTTIVDVIVPSNPITLVEVGILSGPKGDNGTLVVPVPYDDWPPADPQDNTLYLRLAP